MWAPGRVQAFCLLLAAMATAWSLVPVHGSSLQTLEVLGKALFSDTNLSHNRTVACATCHDPGAGFADPRDNGFAMPVSRAVSLGDDGITIGDRNAPSLGYVQFSPAFHKRADGAYVGGQFWDGRETTLEAQREGPCTIRGKRAWKPGRP